MFFDKKIVAAEWKFFEIVAKNPICFLPNCYVIANSRAQLGAYVTKEDLHLKPLNILNFLKGIVELL